MDENTNVEVAETVDVSAALTGLDFSSTDTVALRKRAEEMKAQAAELSSKLKEMEKTDNAKKREAQKLAGKLLKSGLPLETVSAVLKTQFGKARKPVPVGAARKSHKLSGEDVEAIQTFVQGRADGTSAKEIWTQFANLDKPGISIVVKQLVKAGKIRAEGNTRQRKYFPTV